MIKKPKEIVLGLLAVLVLSACYHGHDPRLEFGKTASKLNAEDKANRRQFLESSQAPLSSSLGTPIPS
jgi:hypothetical protein